MAFDRCLIKDYLLTYVQVSAMERSVAERDVQLTEIEARLSSVESTSYDGTLLWKISDVTQRRRHAASIQSPAFYTSRTGQ